MTVGVHVSVMSNMVISGITPPLLYGPLASPVHDLLLPPPAPTPIKFAPCVEAAVPVLWPPGFALQQNKLTTTVLHKFQFIMLEGHDCGYMITHISIPPTNLMLPIIIAFSSRKVMFSASKVKANGTAVGCSQLLPFPLQMMTCAAPASLPTSSPPLNVLNSVEVGMTAGDIWSGIIGILFSIAADLISWALSEAKKDFFVSAFSGLESAVLRGLLGKLFGYSSIGSFVVKTVFGALAGGAKILITGDGSIKIQVGSGYGGVTVTYTQTNDGKKQYTIQGQRSTPTGSESVQAQHTTNPDGSSSNQTTHTEATPLGQHTSKSKTDYDASGHETKTTDTDVVAKGGVLAPEVGSTKVSQSKTTTEPGKAPQTSQGSAGGIGTPIGSSEFWGAPL